MYNIRNDTLGLSPFGGFNIPQKGIALTTAMLGSAGISAAGSVLNNILGNKAAQGMSSAQMQHEENMYALQYRHAMEAEQRADKRWYEQMDYEQELQKAMLDYTFKNYDSPAQQAKFLRAAGLNPSAMLANGSSPFGNMPAPSVGGVGMMQGNTPAANSGFTPWHQGFENPFAHIGETVKQLAEAQKAMSESEYTDVNTEFALHTFGARTGQELAKLGSLQLANDYQNFLLQLDKINLPKRQEWEIKRIMNESFKFESEGHHQQALQGVADVTEKLLNMDLAIKSPYAANAVAFSNLVMEDMKAGIQQKKSSSYQSYQQGRLFGEQTTTESETRTPKVGILKAQHWLENNKVRFEGKAFESKLGQIRSEFREQLSSEELANIKAFDAANYSALHRLLFGDHKPGDVGKALDLLRRYHKFISK